MCFDKNKMVKCSHCGEYYDITDCIPVYGIPGVAKRGTRYIYAPHLENLDYNTEITESVHKLVSDGFQFGAEFECYTYSLECKARMLSEKYNWTATDDGSLYRDDTNEIGTEFKTPIYRSLNGVKAILISMFACADFSHETCGAHLNVSLFKWTIGDYYLISNYAKYLFNPLRDYMAENESDTVKVCGRYFTYYADIMTDYNSHRSWLNMEHAHEGRIEFRLAKMTSPIQYFWLINMWKEILNAIDVNFIAYKNNSNLLKHKAGITSGKIVKIFQKYVNGKAKCQSEARNTKTENKK